MRAQGGDVQHGYVWRALRGSAAAEGARGVAQSQGSRPWWQARATEIEGGLVDFLAVKDWRKHQHYGKRRPPWIKLYANLLTDATFSSLPEVAQAQLMKLWILASQFGHPLPNNPKLLAGKIGVSGRFHLASLIDSGFLIPCEQDAREMLAKSEQDATPLSTENREQSSEIETTTTQQQPRKRDALGVDGQPLTDARVELVRLLGGELLAGNTATDFLAASPATNRFAWARGLIAMLEPLGGQRVPPDALLVAMQDFLVADRERWPFAGRVFRAFVDDAKRLKPERRATAAANPDDALSKWAAETDAREQSAKVNADA